MLTRGAEIAEGLWGNPGAYCLWGAQSSQCLSGERVLGFKSKALLAPQRHRGFTEKTRGLVVFFDFLRVLSASVVRGF